MTSTDKDNKIRYIPYDGDKDKWEEWRIKTMAVARMREWSKALTIDMSHESISDGILSGTQKTDVAMNEKAWNYLILSCTDKAFQIVVLGGDISSKATRKRENAYEAWQALMKKYAPTTNDAYIRLYEEFVSLTMTKKEDPEEFVNKLIVLNNKLRVFGKGKENEEMVAIILSKIPEMYDTIRRLTRMNKLSDVDIDDLKTELHDCWSTHYGEKDKKVEEKVLNAEGYKNKKNFKKKTKKQCSYCGKIGHMKKDCFAYKNDQREGKVHPDKYISDGRGGLKINKDEVICHICKQKGHFARECSNQPSQRDPSSGFMAICDIAEGIMCYECDLNQEEQEEMITINSIYGLVNNTEEEVES